MKETLPGKGLWHAMFLVSFQTSVPCQCHVVVGWHLSAYFNNFDTFQVQSQLYFVFLSDFILAGSYFVCFYCSGVVGNCFQNCKEGIL